MKTGVIIRMEGLVRAAARYALRWPACPVPLPVLCEPANLPTGQPANGRRGQHTLEFAILIGLATIAAVTMQFIGRRGVQTGLKIVNDAILGEPPAPNPTDDASVNVTANSVVMEQGDSAFRRTTTTQESVTGNSVNEATRLQVLQE